MKKVYIAVFVILVVVLALLFVNYSILKSQGSLVFNGVRIYDAIKNYNYLASNGFDINVTVTGRDYTGGVNLNGTIIETHSGWFVLDTGNRYRIVEGPMGSQDVMAEVISFSISPLISIEAVYPPAEVSIENLVIASFDKFRGDISINTEEMPTASLIQTIRNIGNEVYIALEKIIEVEDYNKGLIIRLNKPINISTLDSMISLINDEIKINKIRTGYRFYYRGADDEDTADKLMADLQGDALMVRKYEI